MMVMLITKSAQQLLMQCHEEDEPCDLSSAACETQARVERLLESPRSWTPSWQCHRAAEEEQYRSSKTY